MHARAPLPRRLSFSVSYEGTRVALTRVGFAEVDGGGARPWYEKREDRRVLEEMWHSIALLGNGFYVWSRMGFGMHVHSQVLQSHSFYSC
jgi:hypothetical protein